MEINRKTKRNKWKYKIDKHFYIIFVEGSNGKWYPTKNIYTTYKDAKTKVNPDVKIIKIEGEFFST